MNEMAKNSNDVTALAKHTAATVNNYLTKNKSAIVATLPKGFNFDRMCRTVINAISTTPVLAKCEAGSIFLSTVRAFSLGLEPNGALSEGYLIPFWNSKKGINEAQFMPSYRGLQNLSRRSGEISDIYAKAVCEKDEFDVEEGTERRIVHKPNYKVNRGSAVCYYAVFHTKSGSVDFEVMSREEIDAIRSRSKSSSSGPWVTDYDEMAKKTVMKRLLKRAPMSIELAGAIELENHASMGEANDSILEIDGLEVPEEGSSPDVQSAVNADRLEELKKKMGSMKQDATPSESSSLV